MKYLIQLAVIFVLIELLLAQQQQECTNDTQETDCNGNGVCYNFTCKCNPGYLTIDGKNCLYKQKEKLVAFLLSFFVGSLGADWFYLAGGSSTYIVAGVIKLVTGIVGIVLPCFLGCAGCLRSDGSKVAVFVLVIIVIVLATTANAVWWLADWIRILVGTFPDGKGQILKQW